MAEGQQKVLQMRLFCCMISHDGWATVRAQDGLEVGAAATIAQLIEAFQGNASAPAWQRAAEHLLRIGGESWTTWHIIHGQDL